MKWFISFSSIYRWWISRFTGFSKQSQLICRFPQWTQHIKLFWLLFVRKTMKIGDTHIYKIFFNALKVPRNLVKKIFNCILISHLQHSYHVMKMCNSFCHPWKYFLSKSLSRKILNGYGGTCIASRRHIICMLCFFDKISSSIRFTILVINIFI